MVKITTINDRPVRHVRCMPDVTVIFRLYERRSDSRARHLRVSRPQWLVGRRSSKWQTPQQRKDQNHDKDQDDGTHSTLLREKRGEVRSPSLNATEYFPFLTSRSKRFLRRSHMPCATGSLRTGHVFSQVPSDAATARFYGMSTVSMTWITPLEAWMSEFWTWAISLAVKMSTPVRK